MPASSLWLIAPRDDHPFNQSLKDLITNTLPSDFPRSPKNTFIPHVTITSDIEPSKTYGQSKPQEWLDKLDLPQFQRESNEVVVELEELEAGEPFFKKVTLRARKDENLLKLAAACRRQGVLLQESSTEAQRWAETDYLPHLSLFYGDIPKDEVQKKLGLIELQLGFELGSLFDCCGGTLAMGAKLVLVDTSKPIEEWTPIAERECPWVMWRMARGLV